MSGIYIHIPFCKSKCTYCDFFSIPDLHKVDKIVDSIVIELEERSSLIYNSKIETIYFGGGTPSILTKDQIDKILGQIYKKFEITDQVEITLESNPDDLTDIKLLELKESGINRLSIGVQSFNNRTLKFLNRRHSSEAAIEVIKRAKILGFNNISIDLIYALPYESLEELEYSLNIIRDLPVTHISAYNLTYHEETSLYKKVLDRTVIPLEDEVSLEHHKLVYNLLSQYGFEMYEISNFCKGDNYSRHNRSYWQSTPYLGVGPSAHSFSSGIRSWNYSSIDKYEENFIEDSETLSDLDRYNELVMLSLRTKWGVKIEDVSDSISIKKHFNNILEKQIELKNITVDNGYAKIAKSAIFVSDLIITDFIYI